MKMFAAGTFTKENLKLAFDEFVAVNGSERAIATLKEATGASDIADVPENKIVVGVAALVSSLTLQPSSRMTARGTRRAKTTLAAIHSRLDEIRQRAFRRAT